MIYKKTNKNQWINKDTGETFRTDIVRQLGRKDFSFLSSKEDFCTSEYGLPYYVKFYNRIGETFNIHDVYGTSELFCTRHTNRIADKTVLILGGGPSSSMIDWSDYDYIITSNHYYMQNHKDPYIISFAPYVDLNCDKLKSFLESNSCMIGLEPEFLKDFELDRVKPFYKKYKQRIIVHHTRYSSTLGLGARQAVLAVLMGASEVHLCGLDLFQSQSSTNHAFENIKDIPRWRRNYGVEFQDKQVVGFWEYLTDIAKKNNCKLVNLAENLECNCMSFITKDYK
jgi:hypothetical protein